MAKPMQALGDTLRSVANIDSQAIADRATQEPIGYEYACDTCQDYLWVHYLNEYGTWPKLHEPGFGKLVPCPDCTSSTVAQVAAAKTAGLFRKAGLEGVNVARIDTFDTSRQMHSMKAQQSAELAKRATLDWASGTGPEFLVLTGGTGVGKTHLSQGAVVRVIERGDPGVYVIWADFVFGLRQKLDESHEYMRTLRDAKYLVIDEILSARDTTSFLAETLQDLLGHRTHYNKPTVLAGNLVAEGEPPSERKQWWIDRVGERFVSRMQDKTMVKIVDMWECDDLRPQQGD